MTTLRCSRSPGLLFLTALAAVVFAGCAQPAPAPSTAPLNIVLLVVDDLRFDALAVAGNPVAKTPRLDRLAAEGVRFRNAFVTTSICMVSRASLFTGQSMSRHGIREFGVSISETAWAATYPAVLRDAGYWLGFVGKYGVGDAREADFDFLKSYEGRHWTSGADGAAIHVTERNARDALEFLRSRPSDRPFALSVSFFAPHAEDDAPEQYLPQDWSAALYEGVEMPAPLRGDERYFEALPPFLQQNSNEGRVRFGWRFDTKDRYQAFLRRYYRLVSEVDEAIGRLLDELAAQDVADETLVLVIGDNGYFQGDRGLADKWYPYEESIRVPLLVRDPRLPPDKRGEIRDQIALNIDVAPTLLAAARVAAPARMQGRDLAPLYLQTPAPPWRDEFFYEHPTVISRDRIPASLAVVRSDWKYVLWPEFGFEQLFDLRADPGEVIDLSSDPAHADELKIFRRKLDAWRIESR